MHTTVIALGYQEHWWDILTSAFMRNALIGGTLVALAAGLIGYFTVVRNSAFAAHALAHIGFPGATGAVLLGLPVTLGLAVFCIGGALIIGALGKRADDREVATGTVLAAATGLGLFFSSLATKGSNIVTNVLFGNLLAVTQQQLLVFAGAVVVLAAVTAFVYRPLLFASINPEVAEAKGVPVRLLSVIFMVMLGLAITMAVQAVGTLLLFALVVTPAATAIMLTARPGVAMALSTALSVFSVWVGLTLSAMFNLPPSFVIVTIVTVVWLLIWAVVERTDGGRRAPGAAQGVVSAHDEAPIG
ncbi:metal ABC transporter permease [Mycolicibacterium sp.]|uniref:metal ABC transporter permease n=1 Tax=Mycolicibacterium sp. TaxID=2320850 RepID=UPI00355E5293